MDEIIKIKCPFDGAVLSVKKQAGMETKNVTCPVCKHKYPFTAFRLMANVPKEDLATLYPDASEHTEYEAESFDAKGMNSSNLTLGKLIVVGTSTTYQLIPGRNVVGRKGRQSVADFQIDTAGDHSMSRQHILVEVKKVPMKGFVHYLSLVKEKVNPTYFGDEPLLYGDKIILHDGDQIRLPGATLKFVLPDDEATEI
jgi:hypothetical protein